MKRQVIIHPVLFALFPVVFLYAPNRAFFGPEITLRPAVVNVLLAGLIWIGLRIVTGDTKRAALTVSLGSLLLFTFGPIRDALAKIEGGASLGEIGTANQIIVVTVWAAVIAFAALFKLRKYVDQATYLFNVTGTILVCMSLTDVVIGRFLGAEFRASVPDRSEFEAEAAQPINVRDRPDIYYIVLDGYGRSDQLQRLYGFDNAEFIDFLEDQGFYVAPRSTANYPQTLLSIASSLNFEYLDKVFGAGLEGIEDRRFARELLRQNRVVKVLRNAGYATVSIASPYYESEISQSDTVVTDWRYPTIFELGLLELTPIPPALSALGFEFLYNLHRSRILFSLEKLAQMPQVTGPKFVYSHILYAHPPFVFGEEGRPIDPKRSYSWVDGEDYFRQENSTYDEYVEGYRAQVRFLNQRLRETIAAILAESENPPVIIVQGDHGPGAGTSLTTLERTDVDERYGILNAYHIPGNGRDSLYESVSPVNSFRIVFNHYFGTSYPLLDDKSYYAPLDHPYDYALVERVSATETAQGAHAQ